METGNMNSIQGYEYEDIHICGLCRAKFSDVELFIEHKKHKCPVRFARQQEKQVNTSTTQHTTAPASIGNDPFSQPLLPSGQGSEDKIVVQLEQEGANIGYYPVTHQIEQDPGPVSQHQYVILPCRQDDETGISNQTVQTDSQTYSTLDTVYTLNSHPLQQSSNQIPNNLQEPVSFKSALQTEEPVSFRKTDYVQEPVAFSTAGEFQEPDNTGIPEQTDCVTVDNLQEPVCYRSVEENFQPVNYSKSSLLPGDDTGMISLLQSNQPVVIQNLDNLNLQQTETSIESLSQAHDSNTKPIETQSVLRERLIGNQNSQSDKPAKRKPKQANSQTEQQSQDKTKRRVGGKRNEKRKQNPLVFKYTMQDVEETPKTSPAKKEKKQPPEKKFVCSVCSYKTAYLKDLERHNRTHTGDKPYKCPQCPKAFSRTDKLTLHLRYHMDDRAFKCNFCNYSAVENGSLKKHMKMHLDERPYSCQVCPYKSRSSSQLQIHLRVHTGDKPYSCKYCEAVFTVSSDVHRHMRIHTGEKPFKCPFKGCTYRCAVKSNLKSHYQTHHSSVVENKCSVCDFTTPSRKALFEHKKKHNSNPELTCKSCGYQCSNKSALRHHARLHSNDEPFPCNYCHYKSVQLGNVQAHMMRKHPNKVTRKLSRKKWKKVAGTEIAIRSEGEKAEDSMTEKNPARGKVQPKCVQNYKCDRCPAAFVREDSLRCHLKQHDDQSLSTAYAVLKLQQPVINTSNNPTTAVDSTSVSSSSETLTQKDVSQEVDPNAQPKSAETQSLPLVRNREHSLQTQSQVASIQGQTIPNQAVTLGINDILMAAGISGLNSTGNSPTSKLPSTGDTPAQDLSLDTGIDQNSNCQNLQSSGTLGLQSAVVGRSPQDIPSVQVMQNVSLPYIKLPNGQVLILTGQTSMNQIITQPDGVVQSDSGMISNAVELQSQLLSQPTGTQQQQIVQCAADSTVATPPPQFSGQQPQGTLLPQPTAITAQDSALTQQQGAIPIQLILPSDSQQSVPIVSQLLNSVMNRNAADGTGQNQGSLVLQGINQTSGTDNVQNFVLQIPSQSGISRDPSGNLGESQSFVLQIPGTSNFNP